MDRLPIWLTLRNRPVLVVGGGPYAAAKARLVLKAGALLTIVAPSLGAEARQIVKSGSVRHNRRPFVAKDIAGHAVVFGATGKASVDTEIAEAAAGAGIPVNIVDRAELSTFMMPAIIDRSPVLVGISTDGTAPALARQIRAQIESVLPPRLGNLARLAYAFRAAVKAKIPNSAARLRFWNRVFSGSIAESIFSGEENSAQRQFIRSMNAEESGKAPEGSVQVVGAGPGDPDLLTVRAMRLIQSADVIIHDRLVAPEILEFSRRDAERIYVGKEPNHHTLSQDKINALMARRAKAGNLVVRLKGGDPFMFGRGGEEVGYLQRQGIDVDVVPGITAALGCAAAAGIPLTHRDAASGVTFLTGHNADDATGHDWAAVAQSGHTVVVYMGVVAAGSAAANLIWHGMDPTMPVAVIENGTLPEQRVITGQLNRLEAMVLSNKIQNPALIIIGEVTRATNVKGSQSVRAQMATG
jgi:uroporphyrin-III C-methyltransferase/precorrin-2 dehydrogenase/sirohydrochlorin ferrochelatase